MMGDDHQVHILSPFKVSGWTNLEMNLLKFGWSLHLINHELNWQQQKLEVVEINVLN